MNPTKDNKVKERFETPRVTNLEGKDVHRDLEEQDLETISGGAATQATTTARIEVDGHLCLGGG